MGPIFYKVEGRVADGSELELKIRLDDPRVTGLTLLQSCPVQETAPRVLRVIVGDLYGSSSRHLGILFCVASTTWRRRRQL